MNVGCKTVLFNYVNLLHDDGIEVMGEHVLFSGDAAEVSRSEVLWCLEWFTLEWFSQTHMHVHMRTHIHVHVSRYGKMIVTVECRW